MVNRVVKKVDIFEIDMAGGTQVRPVKSQIVKMFMEQFSTPSTAYGSTGMHITVREVPELAVREVPELAVPESGPGFVLEDGRHRVVALKQLHEDTQQNEYRYMDVTVLS